MNRVTALGIGPTVNTYTEPLILVAVNEASWGTSRGMAIAWCPGSSRLSNTTVCVLRGSGGCKEVAHHASTVARAAASSVISTDRRESS